MEQLIKFVQNNPSYASWLIGLVFGISCYLFVNFMIKAREKNNENNEKEVGFFLASGFLAGCNCAIGIFMLLLIKNKEWVIFKTFSVLYFLFLILSVSLYFWGLNRIRCSPSPDNRKIKISQKKLEEKIKKEKEKLNIH